ncbi:hypothetical protein JCM5350_002732 [Sporobolomyces pararoseus]
MKSYLAANPKVEPYEKLLLVSKHQRAIVLSTTLSPVIYVSSKNSDLDVEGGVVRAGKADILVDWMLKGRSSQVVRALESKDVGEELTVEEEAEMDDSGHYSADETGEFEMIEE